MHLPLTHSHPPSFTPKEAEARSLLCVTCRLFFQVRQTVHLRKTLSDLQLHNQFPNISQQQYDSYVDLEDNLDRLIERLCLQRVTVALERIRLEEWENRRKRNDYVTRHAVAVWEHRREGAEADGDIGSVNDAAEAKRLRDRDREAEMREGGISTIEDAFEAKLQEDMGQEAGIEEVDEKVVVMDEAADWELAMEQETGGNEEATTLEEVADWELEKERKSGEVNEDNTTKEATQASFSWESHANSHDEDEDSIVVVEEESDSNGVFSLDEDTGQESDEESDFETVADSPFGKWFSDM